MLISTTSWPESLPAKEEGYFFSVHSGTKKLSFGFHNPTKKGGIPFVRWSTKHLDSDGLKNNRHHDIKLLAEYLPKHSIPDLHGKSLHKFFFDTDADLRNDDQIEKALHHACKKAKEITVYIVTSDGNQTQNIAKLFNSSLRISRNRIHEMSNKDFFTEQLQSEDFMVTSVLASLRGAATLEKGSPCLIIDVNDGIRFAGVDKHGKMNPPDFALIPGLKAQLYPFEKRNLCDFDYVVNRCEDISQANDEDEKLTAFSMKSEKDNIIHSTFMCLLRSTHGIMMEWSKKVSGWNSDLHCNIFIIDNDNPVTEKQNGLTANQIFYKLLTEDNHGGWIHKSCFSQETYEIPEHWSVLQEKIILHVGVAYAVMHQFRLRRGPP